MGKIKGCREYEKFKRGEKLSRAEAMKAQCYECNGLEGSRCDCQGKNCPMYQYHLYPGVRENVEL